MALHLFNPENDLALACFDPHYIPPQSARKMAGDLSTLPAWWAKEGDAVCVASVEDAKRLFVASKGLCPSVHWVSRTDLGNCGCPQPWGWSPFTVTLLRNGGCPEGYLPDKECLLRYKDLSGRRHAVDMLAYLRGQDSELRRLWGAGLCGTARYCTDEGSIIRSLSEWPDTILKAPWSGSGKGLRLGRNGYVPPLSGWCRRLLKEQGGVVVEPLYNKVYDFALEYEADGQGGISYKGLSLFETNRLRAYAGNRVATEDAKERWLMQFVPETMWQALREDVGHFLKSRFASDYSGPLGVDMMLCMPKEVTESAGNMSGACPLLVHPCVEVNLRRTMGWVSVYLTHLLACGTEARFVIDYFKENARLMADHECLSRKYPLRVENGRLRSGYLPLTPVTSHSLYRAMLLAVDAKG